MRRNRFQNKVATSNFTLPVAAFLTTLLWCAEGIYTPDRILGWAVCGLTAYFWVETNNAHSLIRIRSRLTPAIYLWMTGCIFSLHPLQDGLIVSCLMLASYYLLFKSYQRTEAVSPIFHSFLCLGIGSLFFPQLLFFAPFYLWYATVYLRSLTWRTFWAAMTGLILPYWFMALQPVHFQVLLGLLVMNSAPILSHYFALTGSRFTRAVFMLFLFMFAALSFLNVWTQWLTF